MDGATLVERFAHAALSPAGASRGVTFIDRQERETFYSYRQLLARARRVAGGLLHLGLSPGQQVALILPTSVDFYDGFFGALLAGCTPVPLYPPVRLGRLDEYHAKTARMLSAAQTQLVLTDARVERVIGRSIAEARPPKGVRRVAELRAASERWLPANANDLALVQFSSGTTVDPRAVALTHRQLLANIDVIIHAIFQNFPEEDGWVHKGASWLPLYHDMGLIGCVLVAALHPGDLALLPPEAFIAKPSLWLRAISRHQATISAAPNFAYSLACERIVDEELAGVDLSSWRMALNGAEPVVPAVLERFISRFEPYGFRPQALSPVYGLAEAALAVTFSSPKERVMVRHFDKAALHAGRAVVQADGDTALVSVGRVLPGYDVEIRDADGQVLEDGSVGNIWVRGPSLMRGYLGNAEASAQVLQGGWLDTGDCGFVDAGELFVYGRAKDIIILRGKNYAPTELEHLLDDIEGVRVGCTAAVGAYLGDEGEVLVIFAEHRAQDADALVGRIKDRLATHTGIIPAMVVLLAPGTLPRTSSGKIRRREAWRRFDAGTLAPPEAVTWKVLLKELVRSRWHLLRMGR